MNHIVNEQIKITLQSGDIDFQRGLHAILRIIPNRLPLPYSGGRYGKEGTAVVGFGSIPPRTVWCISPSLRGGDTDGLIRCALWLGLQRCATNDFLKVGIELDSPHGCVLSPKSLAAIAVETVLSFARKSTGLSEIRLVTVDPAILRHTSSLLEATERPEEQRTDSYSGI